MIDLKKLVDERIQKIMLTVEVSTQKIFKKEINKMRKDLLKEMLKNG